MAKLLALIQLKSFLVEESMDHVSKKYQPDSSQYCDRLETTETSGIEMDDSRGPHGEPDTSAQDNHKCHLPKDDLQREAGKVYPTLRIDVMSCVCTCMLQPHLF